MNRRRIRFTLRDLLWSIVWAAILVAWAIDRQHLSAQLEAASKQSPPDASGAMFGGK